MEKNNKERLEDYNRQLTQILTEVKTENIISKWKLEHPNGTKADCIRDTKLSEYTVYKYWRKTGYGI